MADPGHMGDKKWPRENAGDYEKRAREASWRKRHGLKNGEGGRVGGLKAGDGGSDAGDHRPGLKLSTVLTLPHRQEADSEQRLP